MHIQRVLEKIAGVVGGPHGAATLLGMKRTTLLDRMRKLAFIKCSNFDGLPTLCRSTDRTLSLQHNSKLFR